MTTQPGAWDFPYALDGRGRTATTDASGHVRDLVEQVLLTAPGERVMRPGFGAGLLHLVFEPGGPQLAATTQYLVQAALDQTLVDVAAVESVSVDVTADGAGLLVTVAYMVQATRERGSTTVTVPGGGA
jgi:phage baseplate assembly protein W